MTSLPSRKAELRVLELKRARRRSLNQLGEDSYDPIRVHTQDGTLPPGYEEDALAQALGTAVLIVLGVLSLVMGTLAALAWTLIA